MEFLILMGAIALGIGQIFLATGAATLERGVKWNMSSRDESSKPLSPKASRLERASKNFQETFPFFLAAMVALFISGKSGGLSLVGAGLYLLARLIYVPLYAFDVTGIRSMVWMSSIVGIGLILLQALIG